MGCGGSKSSVKVSPLPTDESKLKTNQKNKVIVNGDSLHSDKEELNTHVISQNSNGEVQPVDSQQTIQGSKSDIEKKELEKNKRNEGRSSPHDTVQYDDNQNAMVPMVSKGVAFDVGLGDDSSVNKPTSKRRPPHKLQRLESAPKLTAEMLAQKIAAAEENRQKELEKRARRTSKRRKELLEAREMDKAQQQKAEFDQKTNTYDKNRSKLQAEIIAKQQRREERAKRVRHKAQRLKNGEDDVPVLVDPDETYNANESDDDLWEDNKHEIPTKTSETESESPEPSHEDRRHSTDDNKDVHDFFDS